MKKTVTAIAAVLFVGTASVAAIRAYASSTGITPVESGLPLAGGTLASTAAIVFGARGSISASADGVFVLKDTAGTSFSRLALGGTTSSFPAIKRNSASVDIRTADDSAYAYLTSRQGVFQGSDAATYIQNASAQNLAVLGEVGTKQLQLASDWAVAWTASTTSATAAKDTVIARDSIGVVTVTSTMKSAGLISTTLEADLAAGACTAGTWKVDNAGGTRELCRCNDAGSAYDCISVTTANGPTN